MKAMEPQAYLLHMLSVIRTYGPGDMEILSPGVMLWCIQNMLCPVCASAHVTHDECWIVVVLICFGRGSMYCFVFLGGSPSEFFFGVRVRTTQAITLDAKSFCAGPERATVGKPYHPDRFR